MSLKNIFGDNLYYKKNGKEVILKITDSKTLKFGDKINDVFEVRGSGKVVLSHLDNSVMLTENARIYLKYYTDFELTFMVMITKGKKEYSGCVIGRGLDGHRGENNVVNTYYVRYRNDGYLDVEKEHKHPDSYVLYRKPLILKPFVWHTIKHIFRKNRFQSFVYNEIEENFEKVLDYTDENNSFPQTSLNWIIFRVSDDQVYYKDIHLNNIILEPAPY